MGQLFLHLLFYVLLLPLLAVTAVPVPAPAPAPSPAPTAPRFPLVGGWEPIEDVSDPHVQEIAQYAVTEYNKQSKAELKLEKVVKGETQVVAGINYKLILAAKNETTTNNYEAVVWEKSWENFRNLTSFKRIQ